jgi:hypothetical protein
MVFRLRLRSQFGIESSGSVLKTQWPNPLTKRLPAGRQGHLYLYLLTAKISDLIEKVKHNGEAQRKIG